MHIIFYILANDGSNKPAGLLFSDQKQIYILATIG